MSNALRTPFTSADLHAHIREQAERLVREVNAPRILTPEQFAAKTDEVQRAMFSKLQDNLVAVGRGDLALKLVRVVPA
jgi:hypothetical protein